MGILALLRRAPKVYAPGEHPLGDGRDPGYSGCSRCGASWRNDYGHATPYHQCTQEERDAYVERYGAIDHPPCAGTFPLCQSCWEVLSPTDRLPYYEALMQAWTDEGYPPKPHVRKNMTEAVLAGL